MSHAITFAPRKLFRVVALAEGVTWALLLSGLLIRSIDLAPQWLIPLVGGLHGFTFLSYAVMALLVGVNQRWKFSKIALGVVLAVVPFATIPFEAFAKRSGSLEGSWRTARSENPRDAGWFDTLFRWFIARPVLLILLVVAGVSAVFSFLLWLGPPDTWFD